MDVIKARDQGQISKKNILKMDSKRNERICKLLRNSNVLPIRYLVTLPEQINDCTLSVKDLRKLPLPEQPKMAPSGLEREETED